jgi:hypothetical protein
LLATEQSKRKSKPVISKPRNDQGDSPLPTRLPLFAYHPKKLDFLPSSDNIKTVPSVLITGEELQKNP